MLYNGTWVWRVGTDDAIYTWRTGDDSLATALVDAATSAVRGVLDDDERTVFDYSDSDIGLSWDKYNFIVTINSDIDGPLHEWKVDGWDVGGFPSI